MSRESIYNRYKPSVKPDDNNNCPAYWFIFNSDKMLIDLKTDLKIPFTNKLDDMNIKPVRKQYMGTVEEHPCFSVEVDPETDAPHEMAFMDLHSLYDLLDEDIFLLAGRAIQIVNWDKNHQYCGKCSTPTQTMDEEMAKICPECGFIKSHPPISCCDNCNYKG